MATGDVVILAHAASHSLSGREGVLRVLVTGSREARSARLAASRLISEEQARRLVTAGDANRADYLKRFYGIEAESPTQYDLVIDTDELTVDAAARMITTASAASLRASGSASLRTSGDARRRGTASVPPRQTLSSPC